MIRSSLALSDMRYLHRALFPEPHILGVRPDDHGIDPPEGGNLPVYVEGGM